MSDEQDRNKPEVYHGFRDVKGPNVDRFEASLSPEFKEYRRRWEEYPEQRIVPEFPLNLDVGSTSKCNLACPMCTRTQYIKQGKFIEIKDFDFELFKKMVDEAAAAGLCALNLDNFGEPLMNPQIVEMVRYAKEKGILDVFFHTNATFLTEELAKALIAAGLDRMIFSFDSPYKEKYLKIRVNGNYEQALENIRRFARIKQELNAIRPLTRINCIRFPSTTQKEMDDTVALFAPIVDSVSFLDYVDPVKGKSGKYPEGYVSKFVCPQLFTRMTVWEDGVISPCCMDYDRSLGLGNVKDKTLKEAWESAKRKAILKKHLEGKFYEIPACKNCDFAISGDIEANENAEKENKLK
jgi:radical SAM protein with 4Fe4S-binding SPASM domain